MQPCLTTIYKFWVTYITFPHCECFRLKWSEYAIIVYNSALVVERTNYFARTTWEWSECGGGNYSNLSVKIYIHTQHREITIMTALGLAEKNTFVYLFLCYNVSCNKSYHQLQNTVPKQEQPLSSFWVVVHISSIPVTLTSCTPLQTET